MTSHSVRLAVFMLSLAVAAASSANAAGKIKRPAVPQAGSTAPCRGANLFQCGPLYNGNDYLGTDPDPFIRLMIQRDLGARYGGGD